MSPSCGATLELPGKVRSFAPVKNREDGKVARNLSVTAPVFRYY